MAGGQKENPSARAAQLGLGGRSAKTADISNITQAKGQAKSARSYQKGGKA